MKIAFTGGGTAGHITPNLALINKLKAHTIFYIGTDGMEKQLTAPFAERGVISQYRTIAAYKLQRKLSLGNLLLPFRLVGSVRQAKRHLSRLRPDVVFSKGGYVGLPVVIAAKRLGIPTVIHESDMSPGLANRLSARYADVYLSAFGAKDSQTTGLIVREEILHGDRQKGLQTMGFDGKKPLLLVTGGSLGAKALNDAVQGCPHLAERFDIFVLCGKNKRLDCNFVRQSEFADNMGDIFAAADVCLTRAGANTLSELTLAQVPFVTVPLTKQSRGEQLQNAMWFVERGCGLQLSEQQLPDSIESAVNAAYDNRNAICAKQRAQRALYGTDRVAELILQAAQSGKRGKGPH